MKKLIKTLSIALITLSLLLNVHSYNGLNKGLYIGPTDTCTVGIELVGDTGIFYDISDCN